MTGEYGNKVTFPEVRARTFPICQIKNEQSTGGRATHGCPDFSGKQCAQRARAKTSWPHDDDICFIYGCNRSFIGSIGSSYGHHERRSNSPCNVVLALNKTFPSVAYDESPRF